MAQRGGWPSGVRTLSGSVNSPRAVKPAPLTASRVMQMRIVSAQRRTSKPAGAVGRVARATKHAVAQGAKHAVVPRQV